MGVKLVPSMGLVDNKLGLTCGVGRPRRRRPKDVGAVWMKDTGRAPG